MRQTRCLPTAWPPFFEEHGTTVQAILSDNGTRVLATGPTSTPYEVLLQLEEIEHHTTKVDRPQSNGFIEGFSKSISGSRVGRPDMRRLPRRRRA